MFNSEYLLARHRRMIIRIVEPAQFIRGTVEERRPISLAGNVVFDEEEPLSAPTLFFVAIGAIILGALAYCIAFGLDAFLRVWM